MQPPLIRSPLPVPTRWKGLCRHFAHMWTEVDGKGFVANLDLFHTSGTRKTEDVMEASLSSWEPHADRLCNVVAPSPADMFHVSEYRFS